eukprot:TRINITY_DN49149_c0_g1_i1.p1 TRINITY_DN49149_c0_g1~~TRINITY_DN49149_c0_g1_i1.p1  ORF type:complete len:451 (+),score=30.89 TRINITY_DN49149_c0_g1_i1:50-1402(+)
MLIAIIFAMSSSVSCKESRQQAVISDMGRVHGELIRRGRKTEEKESVQEEDEIAVHLEKVAEHLELPRSTPPDLASIPNVQQVLPWTEIPVKHYAYGFDVIEHEGTRWMYYCGNGASGSVRDDILYRKGTFNAASKRWEYGWPVIALHHGKDEDDDHPNPIPPKGCQNEVWPGGDCVWDKQHVCDPSIVAAGGSARFELRGQKYRFALFYLGIHQDSKPGQPFKPEEANHIGVAVSNSLNGPWFKKNGALIEGAGWWGVGQASATLVKDTTIMLIYTAGNSTVPGNSGQVRTIVDLGDVANPKIVHAEKAITAKGLKTANGQPQHRRGFTNVAMIYDTFRNRFWAIREGKPMPTSGCRTYISSFVQLAWIPGSALWFDDSQEWTIVADSISIPSEHSARTHNPGLVHNIYGTLINKDLLEALVTSSSDTCTPTPLDGLWTYRPWTFAWHP